MKKIIYVFIGVSVVFFIVLAYKIFVIDRRNVLDSNSITTEVSKKEAYGKKNGEIPAKLEKEPQTYNERFEKGEYFLKQGFLSLAAAEFTFASQLNPKEMASYVKLGTIYVELEEYNKAEEALKKALAMDSNNELAITVMGKIFIKKSDFNGAKEYFMKAPKDAPNILYYLGLLESVSGNIEQAKKYFEQAKKFTKDQTILNNINEVSKSFQEFALFSDSETIFLHTLLAKSFNTIDEYEMAIFMLRNVLKQKVDYRDAWILLGYAYLSLEKYDFALTTFEKAYQLDSEKAETQYFLGLTYAELKKNNEAIIYLNIALKNGFEPQIQAKQKLADLYFETKQYDKAAQMYEEVLQLNDSDIHVFVRPVWIYLEFIKNTDKALEMAQKALKRHPNEAMAYNLVGWVYSVRGDEEKGEKYLKEAISKDKTFAAAYLNLGNMYTRKGDKKVALRLYEEAYNLDKFGSIGTLAAENYNKLIIE